ncbi:unnamed protein product [Cylindrotheca closterium]|uniref:Midasin n=1 Tax=Cylindrotheca closterium TaxID=2856 RepID=A0AAD2FQH8_9STRA|nr:unnamed protein product [Cylindrotheca closterium]
MDDQKEQKSESPKQAVHDYMQRMFSASLALSQTQTEDSMTVESNEEDLGHLVDTIARNLLSSCAINILAAETSNLPKLSTIEPMLPGIENEEAEDVEPLVEPYQYRRSDYLRQLLRIMAPMSMQVAAHTCTLVASYRTDSPTLQYQAVVLFSHWLPVAPHLTPMVTEFFQHLKEPFQHVELERTDSAFLVAEAMYYLLSFYSKRKQITSLRKLWSWKFLFDMLQPRDVAMSTDDDGGQDDIVRMKAIRWYSARAIGSLLKWKPAVVISMLKRLEVEESRVQWHIHPWDLNIEEADFQSSIFRSCASLWGSEELALPSSEQISHILPTSSLLADVGPGLVFYKYASLKKIIGATTQAPSKSVDNADDSKQRLILTPTAGRNISLLGSVLCQEPYPPPILVCGPHGSGKSSLVRELLHMCRPDEDSLMEFHIDEETDSKTLIGSYTTTDIPGEFAWRAGALTHATREGHWVLIEDVDVVPIEIQATLVKLLESRMLPLGNGKYERCHPNFRIFGTCTTTAHEAQRNLRMSSNRGGGKRILSPSLWRKVYVKPMPSDELKQVASSLFRNLPGFVIEAALTILQKLDRSGRKGSLSTEKKKEEEEDIRDKDIDVPDTPETRLWTGGRNPSVRDFFKLLSRLSNGVTFENNQAYATEAQRMLCLAECVDIFVGACPEKAWRLDFVNMLAAPIWGVSRDLAVSYIESRQPPTVIGEDAFEIGRARIQLHDHFDHSMKKSKTFAQTNYALRLMESVGVCIRENEAVLLVGETGCGKTSLIQQLAANCERELIVQNLSLQTDSTDLLGGYKPLEIKNVARRVYNDFVHIFVSTFSRKQNAKFLQYAASMQEKSNWKKLSQCFQRASQLGLAKMKEQSVNADQVLSKKQVALKLAWQKFVDSADRFEKQRLTCDAGLAFVFSEGVLVDAIQNGKWVLLDEMNLASADTLQRLCGLLDDKDGSVTLTERGDASAITRHPNFRLFAAMNPATDAGKKDLPASIRSRFSEIYVDELLDPVELRVIACRYLDGVLASDGKPPEHSQVVIDVVDVYLKCRQLAEASLSDGAGHKPRYTLRTLSRALSAAKTLAVQQNLSLQRAIYEGFQLSFEGALDDSSTRVVRKALKPLLPQGTSKSVLEHPGRRPGGKGKEEDYVLLKPFWVKVGPGESADWSEVSSSTGKARFILTQSVSTSLRRLSRAITAGPWPVLLEGPTSAGKTTLVEYIAARCGHKVVRINNHEHTDVQEYTGSFVADQNGSLSFRDGLLVRALRQGHWVILDELNLAPSEVLEALNRLLDDNRELYLAETNEVVTPHPDFRLFATQNPAGIYGGRKPLSRAFRNRFVEIHMGDIPSDEMMTILEKRCACPPSHAKRLVDIMVALRTQRSKSNVFLGKNSFITPRDLLRWAERDSTSKQDLGEHGYMLLAERLRSEDEKELVQDIIETNLKVKLNLDEKYYGPDSEARKLLAEATQQLQQTSNPLMESIAATKTLLRLISLVLRCIKQKEPVLLVGDTGCGKTTVVQFLSFVFNRQLYAVNCHATTETSDLIGGLRPVRGRDGMVQQIVLKLKRVFDLCHPDYLKDIVVPEKLSALFQRLSNNESSLREKDFEVCSVKEMMSIASSIAKSFPDSTEPGKRQRKRRKLNESGPSSDCSEAEMDEESSDACAGLLDEITEIGRRYGTLFEWSDGPLVEAMKSGQMLLLDEMSLAEDAVLERLNSVLEPSRTIVLAEKGDDGSKVESRIVVAADDFRIFATMNPGGDFGKRELSPALRSRFTEIWVPAVTARSDFELVLSRTLIPRDVAIESTNLGPLLDRMLTYVEWFNGRICGDRASPFVDFKLTLRDVLSWARFIVAARNVNSELSMWDAYCHGASLMHIDGFGLGSGLAVEDAAQVKKKGEAYLLGQLPSKTKISNLSGTTEGFNVSHSSQFGSSPFFISTGPIPTTESTFNFTAPTTGLNVFRVLRAMQLNKPVLLEGSPGVGKTSLITALAAASGHKLVRINLSEQTDIADLMGSDLPVSSASGGATFEWCDGILLTAIKEGSWVLLDELNLASQTVLEGLNSCLDHRASVYIPELGKNFDCPSSFRVFAAQNPLAQGGGRKGLPKSFLNRFTKVYVEALKDSDLSSILVSRYPTLEHKLVQKMIGFNETIHQDVVDKREYGSEGSPWEFNLRDVFRWCDLISSTSATNEGAARDLYFQRFRSLSDRAKVDLVYQRFFGKSLSSTALPTLEIEETRFRVGDTTLQRNGTFYNSHRENTLNTDPSILLSSMLPMEAVARCIKLRLPCLLVGKAASGKSSVVSSLAELCNAKLVEQCLSPSSDVTELVGCFEQIEDMSEERKVLAALLELAKEYLRLQKADSDNSWSVWSLILLLEECLEDISHLFDGFVKGDKTKQSRAKTLACILLEGLSTCDSFCRMYSDDVQKIAGKCNEWNLAGLPENKSDDSGHFVWRDGILVEAMVNGYWLVLENVNLCPSSVLDRLNSVTEKDGFLLLSECGTNEGDGEGASTHRLIRPHPNFRIFLTMNPTCGEISRAMRNRCVEISLLQLLHSTPQWDGNDDNIPAGTATNAAKVDILEILNGSGAKTLELATSIMSSHLVEHYDAIKSGEEPPCLRSVSGATSMLAGQVSRGVNANEALAHCIHLSFEKEATDTLEHIKNDYYEKISAKTYTPLPVVTSVIDSWASSQDTAQLNIEAKLLRLFTHNSLAVRSSITSSELGLMGLYGIDERFQDMYKQFNLPQVLDDSYLRDAMVQGLLAKATAVNVGRNIAYLKGLNNECSNSLLWMSWKKSLTIQSCLKPETHNNGVTSSLEAMTHLQDQRLAHQFRERKWYLTVSSIEPPVDPSMTLKVLDASYLIHETLIDRSAVKCSVTPFFRPFFLAVDAMMSELFKYCSDIGDSDDAERWIMEIRDFLGKRDRLWISLSLYPLDVNSESFLGFDETEFIVQWKWIKKSFSRLSSSPQTIRLPSRDSLHAVNALIMAIDRVVFGVELQTWLPHKVSKSMMKQAVPHKAEQFEEVLLTRALANECAIVEDSIFNPFESTCDAIELQSLVDTQHPVFFIHRDERFQILAALCTMQFLWTDEVNIENKNLSLANEGFSQKLRESFETKRKKFISDMTAAKVDAKIATVENQFDVEMLELLKASSDATLSSHEAYSGWSTTILSAFSKVQTSALAEFWCAHEEARLYGEASKFTLECQDESQLKRELLSLLPALKRLVEVVLSQTIWSTTDIRAQQTLIWAIEGGFENKRDHRQLLRCLLPQMLSSMMKHMWRNSFSGLGATSMSLDLPNMWYDDESQQIQVSSQELDRCYGSKRLGHWFRSEFFIHFFHKNLAWSQSSGRIKIHTIENHTQRKQQNQDTMRMLSSLSFSGSKPRLFIAHLLLHDVLDAVNTNETNVHIEKLLAIARQPERLMEFSFDDIQSMSKDVEDGFLHCHLSDVLTPLLQAMQEAWKQEDGSKAYDLQFGLVSIYLGILRLHILAPDSPLDPGRAPVAKMALIDRKLIELETELIALRLDSGFMRGDFAPSSDNALEILETGSALVKKRMLQAKKVVERVSSAPPYFEFYRETKDFLDNVAGKPTVLELTRALLENPTAEVMQRAQNWLRTTAAFCQRFGDFYNAYEEVVSGLISSMQLVQDGILVISQREVSKHAIGNAELLKNLLTFPAIDHANTIQSLVTTLTSYLTSDEVGNAQEKSDLLFSLSVAILARLLMKQYIEGLTSREMVWGYKIFEALGSSHHTGRADKESLDETLEDAQEREFREQFPSHRDEFNALLRVEEEEDDDDASETQEVDGDDDAVLASAEFSDAQMELLCRLHNQLFSGASCIPTDQDRTLLFHSSYNATCELEKQFGCTKMAANVSEPMGAHVYAMALTNMPKKGIIRCEKHYSAESGVIDFQNEPCPSEVMMAAGPLERLVARTTQLLTAFPGHSILLGLGRVCEKVRKLDLMTTPIGKVMTGLEVILRQAQDWEQHASDRVRLGEALHDVGGIVAKWRKLELQSWSQLLQARQDRQISKARKYLLRLHGVLHTGDVIPDFNNEGASSCSSVFSQRECSSPIWIWKGFASSRKTLCGDLDNGHAEDLTELVKALDTFILTSPLGEFGERLRLLQPLSVQLYNEYRASSTGEKSKMQQSRIVESIWRYYCQFQPLLQNKVETMKSPIEKKLKDTVKLAKWDEQSYYALAESSEKNHRQLMKVLSEMDECLGLNVGLIIQEDSYRGIRSRPDSQDEFCAQVPSNSVMFPLGFGEDQKEKKHGEVVIDIHERQWIDASLIGVSSNSHLSKIGKYAMRMSSMSKKGMLRAQSVAFEGSVCAVDLCEALFDRIGSLREKSTRPMKERAVVDLFRELKRNGFTTAKWSTPKELRQMEHIFQLPAPKSERLDANNASELKRGEKYFMRCLTEAAALRSETLILGSKYMTTREMNLMTSLSDSMLLMVTQQRSLVAIILDDTSSLQKSVSEIAFHQYNLPTPQSEYIRMMREIEVGINASSESIKELSLFFRSSKDLLDSDEKVTVMRDAITKLETMLLLPKDFMAKKGTQFVSWDQVKQIEEQGVKLQEARFLIEECRNECKVLGLYPLDIFDVPLHSLSRTIEIIEDCNSASEQTQDDAEAGLPKTDLISCLASVTERLLITFQNFCTDTQSSNNVKGSNQMDDDALIMECHKDMVANWSGINLKELNQKLVQTIAMVQEIHNDAGTGRKDREVIVQLASDIGFLADHILSLSQVYLQDSLQFYSANSKLLYVVLRVFRVLVSKGYCSDETAEEEDGDAEGDINGMTFEDDQDGTGMGEGEGKKDVSDQLESEDQLAGLKPDQDNEDDKAEKQESRQLDEDEADQGMEMENDFDGEMCDLPDKEPDDGMEEEEGEELDREMGDDASPDDQVVDEKMWNESDDEDDINKEDEKFEKDSGVEGEAIEGETRTKDDDEGEDPSKEEKKDNESNVDEHKPNEDNAGDDMNNQQSNEEDMINEDFDNEEEQHGVDVRGEEHEQQDENNDEGEMQLDDNVCLDGEDDNAESNDTEEEPDQDENPDDADSTEIPIDNPLDQNAPEDQEEGDDQVDQSAAAKPQGQGTVENDEDGNDEPEDEPEENALESMKQEASTEEAAHGVRSNQGTDAVKDDGMEEDEKEEEANDEEDVAGGPGSAQAQDSQNNDSGQGGGYSEQDGATENQTEAQAEQNSDEIPNPFKDPGDASKFWHKKLNMVDSSSDDRGDADNVEDDDMAEEDQEADKNTGDFEYASKEEKSSTQVLGEATEEEATKLDDMNNNEKEDDPDQEQEQQQSKQDEPSGTRDEKKKASKQSKRTSPDNQDIDDGSDEDDAMSEVDQEIDGEESETSEKGGNEEIEDDIRRNLVSTDFSKLTVGDDDAERLDPQKLLQDEQVTSIDRERAAEAKSKWLQIQGETHNLARRLCEKLRLVMEPLVASKLRGDYRTGKRINMKRVIGYIASGYRKDKIWLRRTKPAKRNYRVLLAVDDSESMKKSGAGELALRAMATLAVGINQLEIGELGIASFGDDMKLLHPYHLPFTSESGSDMVVNFGFDQKRTRTALCVESALASFEEYGDNSSMQLVFLISDGRIERDSRAALQRLIREMAERTILLAMIIVEGDIKKKDSIVNMKEVTFEKGKPVVKRFIEEYPLPYYIVLDDMTTLPEVLGDALKQWFEILAQLNSSR